LKGEASARVFTALPPVAANLSGTRESIERHALEIRIIEAPGDACRLVRAGIGLRQVRRRGYVPPPKHPKGIEGIGGHVPSKQALVRYPRRQLFGLLPKCTHRVKGEAVRDRSLGSGVDAQQATHDLEFLLRRPPLLATQSQRGLIRGNREVTRLPDLAKALIKIRQAAGVGEFDRTAQMPCALRRRRGSRRDLGGAGQPVGRLLPNL